MKHPHIILPLLLGTVVFLQPGITQAQYLQKQMKSLRENIGSTESAEGKTDSRFSQARDELSALQQLESYVSNDDYSNAIRTVKQAMAKTGSETNKKLWQTLLADLENEQARHHAALKKKVDEKLTTAATAILKAKKVEDLDPLIDDLNDFQNVELSNSSTPFVSRLRNRVSQANNFINRWQNYLEAVESETASRQIEILNDLIQNRSSYRLIDKTKLVEVRKTLLKTQIDKVASLTTSLKPRIAAAKTPEDLQPIVDEISELQNSLAYNTGARRTTERILNTLNNWLNVLASESSGNSQQLLNNLNSFESNSYNQQNNLITQELLDSKRVAAMTNAGGDYDKKLASIRPHIDAVLARAQKENKPAAALDTLDQLQNYYSSNNRIRSQLSQLRNELERTSRLQQHLANNRPTDFFSDARQQLSEDNPWFATSQSLRDILVLKGVEQFFGLKVSLKKGSNLNTALHENAKAASTAGNWIQVRQCYKVLNALNPSCSAGSWSSKLKTTEFYLEGLRLKEAGEKELALTSFQNVLYADPDGIPRKEAIAALKEVRGK